jgi:small subunit ribosomal protein S6
LTTYEGLFVFPERLQDQEIEEARGSVVADLERCGAMILGARKLGRRTFARPMKKMRAGVYVRMVFDIDGQQVTALRQRLRLNETLMRSQITSGDEKSLAWVQEPVSQG